MLSAHNNFFREVNAVSTQELVDKAVEYIESLPNGAISSTNRVIHIINPDLSDDFDRLLNAHVKICEEIEKRGIVSIDYSEHEGKLEGLPYNLTFEVVRK